MREMLAQGLTNWRHFLDVGVPATIQTCAEWWVWEIIIVLSSLLPPDVARGIDADMYVAVMGILLQLASMTYMVLMALQQAAATRVAMELGRKRPAQAQLAAGVCLLAGRVFITTICVTLVAARAHVPHREAPAARVAREAAGLQPREAAPAAVFAAGAAVAAAAVAARVADGVLLPRGPVARLAGPRRADPRARDARRGHRRDQ